MYSRRRGFSSFCCFVFIKSVVLHCWEFFILELFLTREICKKKSKWQKKKTFHCQWMKAFKAFMINLYFRISTACNRSEIKCSIFEENLVVFSFLLLLLGNTLWLLPTLTHTWTWCPFSSSSLGTHLNNFETSLSSLENKEEK